MLARCVARCGTNGVHAVCARAHRPTEEAAVSGGAGCAEARWSSRGCSPRSRSDGIGTFRPVSAWMCCASFATTAWSTGGAIRRSVTDTAAGARQGRRRWVGERSHSVGRASRGAGTRAQGINNTRRFLLEWMSFLHRYVPVGLLERVPQRMNQRAPAIIGRDDLETLMASPEAADWVRITYVRCGRPQKRTSPCQVLTRTAPPDSRGEAGRTWQRNASGQGAPQLSVCAQAPRQLV